MEQMGHPSVPINPAVQNCQPILGARRPDFERWRFSSPEDAVFGTPMSGSVGLLEQSYRLRPLHCGDLSQLAQDGISHIAVDMNHRDRFPLLTGILLEAAPPQGEIGDVDRLLT